MRALLDAAGVAGTPTVVEVPSPGRVNTTTIVAVGAERYAVRAYGWPFGGEPPFDRRAKEAALHPRLAAAGVPVPEVLATATVDGLDGALLEWVPGDLLGVAAQRVSADDLAEAWQEAAIALRRAHGIEVGPTAGFLVADGVQPFVPGLLGRADVRFGPGSYGGFLGGEISGAGRRAAAHLGLDVDRVEAVAAALVPVLDARPVRFGHSDANPWNVLVVHRQGRWRLAAWLDWEFAWAADPAYDVMRATVQRYAPIGPVPDAFWAGYGESVDAVGLAAATLHHVLGLHAEVAEGARSPELDHLLAHGPDPVAVLDDLADRLL